MRTPPRRRHAAHPVTEALDDRNPVSIGFLSAATAGLAASVSTLDVPGQTAESETATAPIALSRPIGSPISLALHSSQASAVPQSRAESSPSIAPPTEGHTQPVADPPHHPVSVDDPFASTIITLSAVSSPGRSLLGVPQQPTFSGLVPNPSSAAPSRATAPASRGAVDDGVRPMTMAATAPIVPNTSSPSPALQSGATAGGDMIALDDPSGGGGDPGDPPPFVFTGSGGAGLVQDPNDKTHYTIPKGLPVGTVFTIGVTGAAGYQIDTASLRWTANDSGVSQYFGINYGAPAPSNMHAERNVQKEGNANLTFIVDARERLYTVKVKGDYVGVDQAPPELTLTFQSHRPTKARLYAGDTIGKPVYRVVNGKVEAVLLDTDSDKGMVIHAETQTNQNFGGKFMFLQLADMHRYRTTDGQRFQMENIGNSHNEDNSFPGEDQAIGYPIDIFTSGDKGPRLNGWIREKNTGPIDRYMNDTPNQSAFLAGLTQFSIGTDPAFGPPEFESFTTYLMYQPTENDAWVALAKFDWKWAIAFTNPPLTKVGEGVVDYNKDGAPVYDEWPEWTGTTTQALGQGWKPVD